MMLPQRPYFPIGSLHGAIVYPRRGQRVQRRAGRGTRWCRSACPSLPTRLDEEAHWNRMLSLGEQQRLGLARALLHAPKYLFLDEATASLDEPSEAALYRLLLQKLPATTIVSIGHRSTLEAFHDRKLTLVRDGDRFALSEAVRKRKTGVTGTLYSQRCGHDWPRIQRCQTRAKAASSSAPASTGANRNVQGRLPDITSSGLMPAGG